MSRILSGGPALWLALYVALVLSPVLADASDYTETANHRDRFFDLTQWQDQLWLVGHPGFVLRSTDQGQTWSMATASKLDAYYSLSAFDEKVALMSGLNGKLYRTEDGGKNWETIDLKQPNPMFNVFALPGTPHAWAVGHFNTLFHSADQGKTWSRQQYEIPEEMEDEPGLNDVFFVTALHGWIVGEFGTILVTEDGGNTWAAQTSPVETPLYAVQFLDAKRGAAVGSQGKIVVTEDGGENWKLVPYEVKQHLFELSLVGETLFAVGQDGFFVSGPLFGSEGWRSERTGVFTWLNAVLFLDAKTGLVAGGRGSILKTTDGGRTWNKISGK